MACIRAVEDEGGLDEARQRTQALQEGGPPQAAKSYGFLRKTPSPLKPGEPGLPQETAAGGTDLPVTEAPTDASQPAETNPLLSENGCGFKRNL